MYEQNKTHAYGKRYVKHKKKSVSYRAPTREPKTLAVVLYADVGYK